MKGNFIDKGNCSCYGETQDPASYIPTFQLVFNSTSTCSTSFNLHVPSRIPLGWYSVRQKMQSTG